MNIIQKTTKFLHEVKVEMSKVTWPTFEELKASTWIVIVISLMFAVYIFGIDRALTWLLKILY